MKNILNKLNKIQTELKAPKTKVNAFAKYKFRNCEDILEAIKPLLIKYKCAVVVGDELINHGERFYVESTANLYDCESGEMISNKATAREDEHKGMSAEQNSGSASSYARKYALNGLLALDDSKYDPDEINTHEADNQADMPEKEKVDESQKITQAHIDFVNNTLKSTGSDVESFLAYMEIGKVEDMTLGEFVGKGKPALDKKLKAKKS